MDVWHFCEVKKVFVGGKSTINILDLFVGDRIRAVDGDIDMMRIGPFDLFLRESFGGNMKLDMGREPSRELSI